MRLPPKPAPAKPLSRPERHEVQRWYDQAVQFAASDGYEEAHRRLKACLERDPGNSLYVELTLRNLESWQPRRRMGRIACWSWRRRVEHASRAENWATLQQLCIEALERQAPDPVHGEALRQWARCGAAFDQLPTAMLLLQWCDARVPHTETLSLAAQTLAMLGRFEDANDAWRQVLQRDPEHPLAKQMLRDGSDLDDEEVAEPDDPTDVAAMIRAAEHRASQQKWAAAQALLQTAMSASPAHPDLQLAWEELQLSHARDQMQQAETQDLPDERREELAQLLARLELEIYDARGTRRPDEPQWRLAAARLLLADRRADAAAKQLEPLPDPAAWPEAWFLYAEAQQRLRQFPAALDHYEKALAHAPGDADWRPQAVEQAIRLAEAMGRGDLAARWG